MKKKTVLSLFAAALAVSMMLGSATPIYAAEPNQIAAQQVQLPAKDLTKFDLMETWHYLSNAAGNPNPAIVRNADGTYNIIMFEGTTVVFDVNNPNYTDDMHEVGIKNYDEVESIVDEVNGIDLDYYDEQTINYNTQVMFHAESQGAAVVNLGVYNGDIFSKNGCQFEKGQNITIGVFVIPAQPGAQAPTYSHRQASDLSAWKTAEEKFGGKADGGGADGYGF